MNIFKRLKLIQKIYRKLIRNKNSYLHTTGWFKSFFKLEPVDNFGDYIPWMNYAVIDFLKDRLKKNIVMFEFGSGYSTLFYSKYVEKIYSVEYNKEWYEKILKLKKNNNIKISFLDQDIDGKYCRSVKNENIKYHFVVIDGRDRVNCFKQSLESLSEEGVILLDDSNRNKYEPIYDLAKRSGFRHINFSGLKPNDFKDYKTTIFYRNKNCFNI